MKFYRKEMHVKQMNITALQQHSVATEELMTDEQNRLAADAISIYRPH